MRKERLGTLKNEKTQCFVGKNRFVPLTSDVDSEPTLPFWSFAIWVGFATGRAGKDEWLEAAWVG